MAKRSGGVEERRVSRRDLFKILLASGVALPLALQQAWLIKPELIPRAYAVASSELRLRNQVSKIAGTEWDNLVIFCQELLKETGGATLTLGAIADNESVKRSGALLIGYTPAGGSSASNTVVNETAFAQTPVAGVATAFSRGDHTHGTPTHDTVDHRGRQLLQSGLDAAKPAAGSAGRIYWATDTGIYYRDNGTAWVEVLRGETFTRLASLSEKAHSSLTGLTTGDDHTQYQKESEKGAASGYASLGADSKVPDAESQVSSTHPAATTAVHGVGASTVESASGSQAKVDTHAALTAIHGATGAVVGTTNTQTLTNKTWVHRTSHVSGGGDALLSTDLLEAIVKRLQESAGPTTLTLGAIADGEYAKRSGTTLIGGTPAGGASKTPVTLIVAASNSKDSTRADYVCDGVADQVEINTAIGALPAAGGEVRLLEGTYTIAASIVVNKSNVVLSGNGWSSIIKDIAVGIVSMIELGDGVSTYTNFTVKDLKLESDYNIVNTDGIQTMLNTSRISIYNVYLKNMRYGVYLGTTPVQDRYAVVSGCIFEDVFESLMAGASGPGSRYVSLANNVIFRNTVAVLDGIVVETCSEVTVTGNVILGNFTESGIFIGNSSRVSVTGNIVRGCTIGIRVQNGAADISITGNTIYLCQQHGIALGLTQSGASRVLIVANIFRDNSQQTNGTYSDIFLTDDAVTYIVNVIIAKNMFYAGAANKVKYHISENAASDTPTIAEGNIFSGAVTAAVNMVGTSSKAFNNEGYNPQGVAAITVTASPFTYTGGKTPETVYIYGGTVSDVSKGATTVATATGISIELRPNEAVVVTYSVLPTMIKDRH